MLSGTPISPLRIPFSRILAALTMVLLPLPLSIPLALRLTGHRHFPDSPDRPPPPHDETS